MGAMPLNKAIPLAAAGLGLLSLVGWVAIHPPLPPIERRIPGQDQVKIQATTAPTDLRGAFVAGDGKPGDWPGAWPWFRGPSLNNITPDDLPLARKWKSDGPIKLWSLTLGEGHAGPAIANGRMYVLDYDHEARADVLRCFSVQDGREIWHRGYSVDVPRNHGMSRTVPAVADNCVVTIGPKCHVLCADATTGDFKWGIDLVHEYKTKVPPWYTGQCPLIDNGLVILAPAGPDALMLAVDLKTGQVKWKTPNKRRWDMTHSSVVPMTFKGKRMYVYCASGGVVGVSADDGALLWETNQWKIATNVPCPIQVSDDRIFLTGYQGGCMMLQLAEVAGKIVASPLYTRTPSVFAAEQQTPILYNNRLYGVITGGQLVCLSLDGKQVWASGNKYRFGLGPFIMADGMIILLSDTGVLSLVEATDAGFKPIAQATVFEEGHDAWGPLALVNGRLIARDVTRMVCLDLRKASYE